MLLCHVARESLLAEISKLKLTHTTCVGQLEQARDEICKLKSMSCGMCSLVLDDDAWLTSL